jgi:hypothetical protein
MDGYIWTGMLNNLDRLQDNTGRRTVPLPGATHEMLGGFHQTPALRKQYTGYLPMHRCTHRGRNTCQNCAAHTVVLEPEPFQVVS